MEDTRSRLAGCLSIGLAMFIAMFVVVDPEVIAERCDGMASAGW